MIPIDSLIAKNYSNFNVIYQSDKSYVMQAFDEHYHPVLLKSFIKSSKSLSFIMDTDYNRNIPLELFFLIRLTGYGFVPKLLNFHDGDGDDDEDGEWSTVVMEFLNDDWMDLFDYISSNNDENCIRVIMNNIIISMYKMCQLGYYYRDIKPENIMVNTNTMEIKFIDLEDMFYSVLPDPICKSTVGTVGYKSPESFDDSFYRLKPSLVFSIGCLAYVSLEASMAFDSEEETRQCNRHPLQMSNCSTQAECFVTKCTAFNVEDRINFHNLLDDEWFMNGK